MPLNDLERGMLFPSTIFHSVASFMTNTNLQHYSGDQHFSNFSQIFFCVANYFLSASVGFCALTAIIRLFRKDPSAGNYFVDMWRVLIYIFLPVAFVLSLLFLQQGTPMTFKCDYQVSTLEAWSYGDGGQRSTETTNHCDRSDSCDCADGAIRNERRRLFRDELRSSLPESDRFYEFPWLFCDDAFSVLTGADVWANVETNTTLDRDIFGDDGAY